MNRTGSNEEKANLLGLFALGSNTLEYKTLAAMAQLYPQASALEALAIREVNKIEENYFTPSLSTQKGGITLFYSWREAPSDCSRQAWLQEA